MTIRPPSEKDIPDISRVHIETWQTTYRGIIADSYLEALSQQKHEDRHHRFMAQPGTVYFVAEMPDEGIIGFLMGGRERTGDAQFKSEIYAINIVAEHRRQGIGSAMIQPWAARMLQAGYHSAMLWVLADNKPAVAFYERLGGKPIREKMIEIGGHTLREIAYAWDDLGALLKDCGDQKPYRPRSAAGQDKQ